MRAVAWADGEIGPEGTKTLNALLRLGHIYTIVAVIDREHIGMRVGSLIKLSECGPPIVGSLTEALAFNPEALILSDLPFDTFHSFPPYLRVILIEALNAGLHLINPQHIFLNDDPELVRLAAECRRMLIDVRRAPPRRPWFSDRDSRPPIVILSAGTDASVGKMTTGWLLVRRLQALGLSARFVATGQIGILIGSDEGIAVDHIEGDFMATAVRAAVSEVAACGATIAVVEGQAALHHPVYGGVALAILHGAAPDAVILSFEVGRTQRKYFPTLECPTFWTEWQAICTLASTSCSPTLLGLSAYGGTFSPEQMVDGVPVPVVNPVESVEPLVQGVLALLNKRSATYR